VAHERNVFEGIERIEARIRRLDEAAAYVQVWDRTDRKNEQNLGRFDLTPSEALPYLDDPWDIPQEEVEVEEEDSFDFEDEYGEPDEEDEPPPVQPASAFGKPTFEQITEAACRWLRELAANNTVGEQWARYRVRVYGPKGMKVLHTGTFVVKNEDSELQCPPPSQQLAVIPTPTFEQAETMGATKGLNALGDYYAQWGRIVLGSVGQLQGVNNQMLGRLHRQLSESRGQVDKLVGSILENRFRELEMTEERQADERADGARHALAREALSQLGDAAKAFLTAKGVNPEMADVLGVLGSSPDLMAALNDPDVQVLMQDPANLGGLAQMLKAAGEQARAAREAMSQPTEPGPQPTAG